MHFGGQGLQLRTCPGSMDPIPARSCERALRDTKLLIKTFSSCANILYTQHNVYVCIYI